MTTLYCTLCTSTTVVDSHNSGMSDTWSRPYSGAVQHEETEFSPVPDPCGMKGILCWCWSLTPSSLWETIVLLVCPQQTLRTFHLSEEGQLLLGSSPLGGSVKAEQGMKMQWCVLMLRSVEDLTVVLSLIVDTALWWQPTGRKVNYFDKILKYEDLLLFSVL